MNILLLILVIGVVWYLYSHSPQGGLQRHLDNMEKVSNSMFDEFIKERYEWDLQLAQQQEVGNGPGSIYSLTDLKDQQKENTQFIQKLKNVEESFLKLKEKTKFEAEKVRLEIYQDWYDYSSALNDMTISGTQIVTDDSFIAHQKTSKESHIKMEIIAKRLKTKLN